MNIEELQDLEARKNTIQQEISEIFQGFADCLTNCQLCQYNEVPESFDNYTPSYGEEYESHCVDGSGNYT